MNSSPAKRRKLSPTKSLSLSADGGTGRNVEGGRRSSQRLSFMSPTRASLAKFNPNVLEKVASNPQRLRSWTFNSSPVATKSQKKPDKANHLQAISRGATVDNRDDASFDKENVKQGLELPTQVSSPSSTSPIDGEIIKATRTRLQEGGNEAPKKVSENGTNNVDHSTSMSPSGLGAADPEKSKLRRGSFSDLRSPHTPTRRQRLPYEDQGSSLPSTPSQLGLEAPAEPPRGILYGTPSKRQRKRTAQRTKGPSPLKPVSAPGEIATGKTAMIAIDLGPKIFYANLPQPAPPPKKMEMLEKEKREKAVGSHILEIGSQIVKESLVLHWLKAGVKVKKRVLKKRRRISGLVNDLKQLREDIELLGNMGGQSPSSMQSPLDPPVITTKRTSTNFLSLTCQVGNILPFSSTFTKILQDGVQVTPDPEDVTQSRTDDLPFQIEIQNSRLLATTSEGLVPCEYDVTFRDYRSSSPQALSDERLIKICLTLDSKTLAILDTRTLASGPWPSSELPKCLNESIRGKEFSVLSTAVGRYFKVADLRSQCWRTSRERFSGLCIRDATSPLTNREQATIVQNDEDESHNDLTQSIKFHHTNKQTTVSLTIEWMIGFDPSSGDVRSRVRASPEFPSSWLHTHEGGSSNETAATSGDENKQQDNATPNVKILGRVGEAFDALVKEVGVTDAIGVIVKVLFPFA